MWMYFMLHFIIGQHESICKLFVHPLNRSPTPPWNHSMGACACLPIHELNMFHIPTVSKTYGSHATSNKLACQCDTQVGVFQNINDDNDRWDSVVFFNSKPSGSRWSELCSEHSGLGGKLEHLGCFTTAFQPPSSSWGLLAYQICKIMMSS